MKVQGKRVATFTIELTEDEAAAVACAAIRGLETGCKEPAAKLVKDFHYRMVEAWAQALGGAREELPTCAEVMGPRTNDPYVTLEPATTISVAGGSGSGA